MQEAGGIIENIGAIATVWGIFSPGWILGIGLACLIIGAGMAGTALTPS